MKAFTFATRSRLCAAASLVASIFTPTFASDGKILGYEDTFNLEFVASPQFIDDDRVIYRRQSMDIMTDGRHSQLWQINLKTGEHRPFLASDDSVNNATLSPDGSMLAYTQTQDGRTQIFVYYLDSRQSVRLTNINEQPSNISWSHDNKTLAFTLFTEHKQKPLFTDMPSKPKGATWSETAKYIDAVQYRRDGRGYLREGYQQVYILPVEGGTPRQLTKGKYPSGGTLSFSQDDEWIYFSSAQTEDYALHPLTADIYRVNTQSAEVEQVTDMAGPESQPKLSPNGKYLAFSQLNDRHLSYQNSDIMVMALASGKVTSLTSSLDRAIGKFVWQQNSKGMVFSYLDQGKNRLATVDLDGDIEKLDVAMGGNLLVDPILLVILLSVMRGILCTPWRVAPCPVIWRCTKNVGTTSN